jgi:hypothetical protein
MENTTKNRSWYRKEVLSEITDSDIAEMMLDKYTEID